MLACGYEFSTRFFRIAFENRRIVNSKAHLVIFKSLSISLFKFEFIILPFHFELHKVYLDGQRRNPN